MVLAVAVARMVDISDQGSRFNMLFLTLSR